MSRKCPKRHHLFLNWLKSNRLRFIYAPRLLRTRNNQIDFELSGINKALRFIYYCRLSPESCSWLSVDAMWQGQKWDGLGNFFAAEMLTNNGWITLRQPPENRRYWQTRKELWIELCFEVFLTWCNQELTSTSWLELSEGFGIANAEIRHEHTGTGFMSGFEQELRKHSKAVTGEIEQMAAEVRYIKIPLFKNSP